MSTYETLVIKPEANLLEVCHKVKVSITGAHSERGEFDFFLEGREGNHLHCLNQKVTALTICHSTLKYFQCFDTVFENCRFIQAQFVASDFHNTRFENCIFSQVSLTNTYLENVEIEGGAVHESPDLLKAPILLMNCVTLKDSVPASSPKANSVDSPKPETKESTHLTRFDRIER